MKKAFTLIASLLALNFVASAQEDVIEHTTTTTTTGTDNVNINMGMPAININMSIPGSVQSSSTTTTTTTRTTAQPVQQAAPPPRPAGNGCFGPASPGDFQSMKSSISSKPFEDNKVQIAKQIIGNNCVSAAQVKELMGLFSFEENKLEVAKFSYGRCVDPNNYYKLNDAFTFSGSIDELNEFIGGH